MSQAPENIDLATQPLETSSAWLVQGIIWQGAQLIVVIVAMLTFSGVTKDGSIPFFLPIGGGVASLTLWVIKLDKGKIHGTPCLVGGFVIGFVIFGALLAMSAWNQADMQHRYYNSAGLDGNLASYLDAGPQIAGHTQRPLPGEADLALVGLPVLVDMDRRAFDPLNFRLPDELRPTRADQVGTIVQVQWYQQEAGRYTDGAIGYRWKARVRLVVVATGLASETVIISGRSPRDEKSGSGNTSGSRPYDRVVKFVTNLPREAIPSP